MSRHHRPDRRAHKRLDMGNAVLATMPWKVDKTFSMIEGILKRLETTGDIDTVKGEPVFQAPDRHEWFDIAPALEGTARFFEIHAETVGRDMPTAPLRQLANKFMYGVMIFPSDTELVRDSLPALRAESLKMTLNYADTLSQAVQEAA